MNVILLCSRKALEIVSLQELMLGINHLMQILLTVHYSFNWNHESWVSFYFVRYSHIKLEAASLVSCRKLRGENMTHKILAKIMLD